MCVCVCVCVCVWVTIQGCAGGGGPLAVLCAVHYLYWTLTNRHSSWWLCLKTLILFETEPSTFTSSCERIQCQGLYQFMERLRALSQLWRTGMYSPLLLHAPSLSAPRGRNTSSVLCSFFSSSLVLQ